MRTQPRWNVAVAMMLILNDQLKHHLEHWNKEEEDDDDTQSREAMRESEHAKEKAQNSPLQWSSVSFESTNFFVFSVLLAIGIEIVKMNRSMVIFLVMALVLLIGAAVWKRQEWRNDSNCKELEQHRLQLCSILGRMGAPPLSSFCKVVVDKAMVNLVLTMERLLMTMDDAMERLQSVTSMSLGLGVWSPSVHRVSSRKQTLGSCKRVLAQTMLESLSLLQDNDETEMPAVVTIGWLSSTRLRLVNAVAKYLYVVECADVCRQRLEELVVYLQCSFMKTKKSASPLDAMAQQLHAAEIALWAYQQDDAHQQEWLQQFQALLQRAEQLREMSDAQPRVDTLHDESHAMPPVSTATPSDPTDFEDKGSSSLVERTSTTPVNKTLVFTGKGSVTRRHVAAVTPVIMPSSGSAHAMSQAMLFHELQTRLETLDLVEEVNVNGEDYDEQDAASLSTKAGTTTLPVFRLTGNLLSELQASIGQQRDSELLSDL